MKLKNMVNKDIPEVIKKLLYGLDYKTTYIVEFLHDMSVVVREVDNGVNKIVGYNEDGKLVEYETRK